MSECVTATEPRTSNLQCPTQQTCCRISPCNQDMQQLISNKCFIFHFFPQVNNKRILLRGFLFSDLVFVFQCLVRKESRPISDDLASSLKLCGAVQRRKVSKSDADPYAESSIVKIIAQRIPVFLWQATVGFAEEELRGGVESEFEEEGLQVDD